MNASHTPPRALWIVRTRRPPTAQSSQSGGAAPDGEHQQRYCRPQERDVEGRCERERSPEADTARGGFVLEHALVVERGIAKRGRREQAESAQKENGACLHRPAAGAVEHEVRPCHGNADERGTVQVRPEGEQRDDEPDGAAGGLGLRSEEQQEKREEHEREELHTNDRQGRN